MSADKEGEAIRINGREDVAAAASERFRADRITNASADAPVSPRPGAETPRRPAVNEEYVWLLRD